MEVVFGVSFGPTFTAFRHFRYRMYKRLPTGIGLRLEELETSRLYRRALRTEKNVRERESLEHEHMWEQQDLDERRAMHIADKIYWRAHRMYLELPTLTGRGDDPNWVQARYNGNGRSYLSRAAAGVLRDKIRAEKKATWELWFAWAGIFIGIGGVFVALYG